MKRTRAQSRAADIEERRPKRQRFIAARTVVTWNMQGGGADATKAARLRRFMRSPDVHVICLQECGNLFGWNAAGAVGLEAGWTIAIHERWDAGGGNERCSLAILVRGVHLQVRRYTATWAAGRPMIAARVGLFWVFCVHAPRNSPAYVASVVGAAARDGGARWICAGDFNLAPGVVAAPAGATILNCGQPTHQGGRELDYAYAHGWTRGVAHRSAPLISDHWAVEFWLLGSG